MIGIVAEMRRAQSLDSRRHRAQQGNVPQPQLAIRATRQTHRAVLVGPGLDERINVRNHFARGALQQVAIDAHRLDPAEGRLRVGGGMADGDGSLIGGGVVGGKLLQIGDSVGALRAVVADAKEFQFLSVQRSRSAHNEETTVRVASPC